jgi:hypothetical protein
MVVVTSEGEDLSQQGVSVQSESGADLLVDRLCDRLPEVVVLDVGAADTAEIGLGHQVVELREG